MTEIDEARLPTPASIQRIYFTLLLGNTLAASLIWGINTIFLLDAGLSNLEAFAANAFSPSAWCPLRGADRDRRRHHRPPGVLPARHAVTLAATTLLYVTPLWQVEGPFWAWGGGFDPARAGLHVLLGRGRGVRWWMPLHATHFEGNLESVFGRGQVVAGAAMLTGSVAGGYIAQVTSLGVPFVLRAVVLGVMFVLAFLLMKDVGFTPMERIGVTKGVQRIAGASIEYGWRVPAVKWDHARVAVHGGRRFLRVLRPAAVSPGALGNSEAYGIADLVAAIVAGAQIVGGIAAPVIRRMFHRRTSALLITAF